MKHKFTLLFLAIFVVGVLCAVGMRKRHDRKQRARSLHPLLLITLAFADLPKVHQAALKNDAAMTKEFLEKGWAVDRQIEGGLTPLHIASMCDSRDCAMVLIEHGADVDFADELGRAPLAFAALGAKPKMVEFLLANGARADRKNKKGQTQAEAARQLWEQMSKFGYRRKYGKNVELCIEMLRQAASESATEQQEPNDNTSGVRGKASDELTLSGIGL